MKLEAGGLDLSRARALLGTARTEIANARTAVLGIPAAVSAVLSSDNPRETFGAVREITKQAEASVKKAHKALVDAIAATKAAGGLKADEQ